MFPVKSIKQKLPSSQLQAKLPAQTREMDIWLSRNGENSASPPAPQLHGAVSGEKKRVVQNALKLSVLCTLANFFSWYYQHKP